eukprot:TRINITY_DN6646_c0_g5_i1.p1 TRINITY_DN6646_c0_g5~~TRINITY_DN6646_c0_g5_i1.p1  ORF type:complete len:473 (-),score=61.54 TRINITY_DN6646_c0_g5_i1:64-1482(-)
MCIRDRANPACKAHKRILEMYCQQCKDLMCAECLSAHAKKDCKHPIFLLSYAKSELLPLYKERLDSFEKGSKMANEAINKFLASSKIVKEGLLMLKAKFENLLETIDRSLELFEARGEDLAATRNSIKGNMAIQYEELKGAVESENLLYIASKLDKPCIPDISDSDKQLVEALKKVIGEVATMEELKVFSNLLSEFSRKYKLFMENSGLGTQSKYIYGSCHPQKNCEILCRYDIQNKRLNCLVDIPRHSSVTYISGRIFISGGNCTNATKEYVEKCSILLPKAPMKYAKYDHTIQVINKTLFAAVGGYNQNYMACCEEYFILDDKWRELPSLNRPREYTATVFVDHKLLYAIGGDNSNNTVEVLNYNERKMWKTVNIVANKVKFNYSPKALIVSKNEVLIFCGNNSNIVGLWDLKDNMVKNYPGSKLADHYFRNQVYVRDRKGYILGHYGHMHIFDLDTRKFTELEYSSMFP